MQAAVTQNGAFAVAPDNGIAQKSTYPHQKSQHILYWQQPPLFLRNRISQDITGRGKRRGAAYHQRQKEGGPCRGKNSA